MSADYLEYTLESCRTQDGRILVAEVEGTIVGFATILTRVPFDNPDSPPGHFAYLMDLAVHASHRGQGIGSLLMAAAEDAARGAQAVEFRTLVLHGNPAVNLYRRAGMVDYSLTLRKRLDDAAPN
jgi:ribosomal protein S18 acetylase RimI-like enzyme